MIIGFIIIFVLFKLSFHVHTVNAHTIAHVFNFYMFILLVNAASCCELCV